MTALLPWLSAILLTPGVLQPALDYLPADSELVVALRWRNIVNSDFGKKYPRAVVDLKRWLDGGSQTAGVARFLGGLAFDPLRDVESVWLTLPGGGEGDSWCATVKAGLPPERIALLLAGVFTGGVKMRAADELSYFEVTLPTSNFLLGFPDRRRTILAGHPDRMVAALLESRKQKPRVGHRTVTDFLATSDGKKHIAFVATPGGFASLLPFLQGGGDWLPSFDGFVHFGGSDVRLEVRFRTSEEEAKGIDSTFKVWVGPYLRNSAARRAEADPRFQPELVIVNTLKSRVEGRTVTVTGHAAAEVVAQLARNFGGPRRVE